MSLRQLFTILLFTLLAIGTVSNSEAQFWKKKSKRHKHKSAASTSASDSTATAKPQTDNVKEPKKTKAQRRKEKKERKKREKEAKKELKKTSKKHKGKKQETTVTKVTPAANTQPAVIKKWADIDFPASQRKAHYRIDILAPMYLDELVKNGYPVKTIPQKAIQGLDFYKGVQIAADTLKKAQFDIDIYVHDVASTEESADMLVSKNMMDSSDLIIGAVLPKDVAVLAGYAKQKRINFISSLTAADGGVKDNPYLTLLQPSLKSNCEWINTDVENKHLTKKALLICRSNVPADDSAYRYLASDAGKSLYNILVCNNMPIKAAFAKWIDSAQTNTLVLAIRDAVYADSVLKTLKQYFPNTHFEITALAGAGEITNVGKPGMYPNMQINYTLPFRFDEHSPLCRYVASVFKTEYGGKPEEQVYRGYETMFWYANMLKRYGTIFNKQYSDNETAPFTKFAVKPQWDEKTGNVLYFENRHLFVRQYTNGVLTEIE